MRRKSRPERSKLELSRALPSDLALARSARPKALDLQTDGAAS